ncbi:MAG: alpha/beta hydrolase [Oscillospiraceae bacterium]
MPDTEQYAPYSAEARQMISDALEIPYKEAVVTSYDGLRLFGKCYIASADAPWLIMLHGYRSGAERDFCGGLKFGIDSGFNVLLVDQRAHGKSEGKCLTFGIKERYDCLTWTNYVISQAGSSCKIALYGMSMGAATVLMAAGSGLPKNVACIVADCGYTSPKAIIKKVIREMHYPVFPTYALVRLGGMLFGGFDIEEYSAVQAMEKCDIPVLFIHGDDDRFVPCDMGRENHRHCRAEGKKLLIVPNAGHGMSYMSDKRAYLGTVSEFLKSALET